MQHHNKVVSLYRSFFFTFQHSYRKSKKTQKTLVVTGAIIFFLYYKFCYFGGVTVHPTRHVAAV